MIVEAAGLLLLTRTVPHQFLLLRHRDRWDLPKGHVEEGEDILSAAVRETEEETGIGQHLIEVDPEFRFEVEYIVRNSKRGNYPKRVSYFLGFVPSPLPVQLTEHEDYKWFDWPVTGSIQQQTIDPLISKVADFLAK
jgi:8-oxo-dGTP pyrophosphatase MutT (NUDIX family)